MLLLSCFCVCVTTYVFSGVKRGTNVPSVDSAEMKIQSEDEKQGDFCLLEILNIRS